VEAESRIHGPGSSTGGDTGSLLSQPVKAEQAQAQTQTRTVIHLPAAPPVRVGLFGFERMRQLYFARRPLARFGLSRRAQGYAPGAI
jgi:hypothetical protein